MNLLLKPSSRSKRPTTIKNLSFWMRRFFIFVDLTESKEALKHKLLYINWFILIIARLIHKFRGNDESVCFRYVKSVCFIQIKFDSFWKSRIWSNFGSKLILVQSWFWSNFWSNFGLILVKADFGLILGLILV